MWENKRLPQFGQRPTNTNPIRQSYTARNKLVDRSAAFLGRPKRFPVHVFIFIDPAKALVLQPMTNTIKSDNIPAKALVLQPMTRLVKNTGPFILASV